VEENMNTDKIVKIPINMIDDFPNHPFRVGDRKDLQDLCNSINENGVLVPTIVREKKDGRYEMISGHRRKKASEINQLKDIPCIVKKLTDEQATIIMVDSNLQREQILPSEKAFAYKMKLEAIKHQGKTTSSPNETKSTAEDIGKDKGDSRNQVYRYVRLTYLIPEILNMVDNNYLGEKPCMAMRPAVEISYLTHDEQKQLLDNMEYNDATPSLAQAIKIRNLSKESKLNDEELDEMLGEEKPNQIEKIYFSGDKLRKVLPKNIKRDQIENYVILAVKNYTARMNKERGDPNDLDM
jgi:ParB family chromosome partitioning protein